MACFPVSLQGFYGLLFLSRNVIFVINLSNSC